MGHARTNSPIGRGGGDLSPLTGDLRPRPEGRGRVGTARGGGAPPALHAQRSTRRCDDARVILPKVRDPRLVTIRRGGTLTDADHRLLALWAADCAEHVLGLVEAEQPDDDRPRQAIEAARQWARGDLPMMAARARGGHAMGAARPLRGAARFAAYAAGQAACVGHVAEHDLGAAAYAIRAAQAADDQDPRAGAREREWQRRRLPDAVRSLVLDDQARRDEICWNVFTA